MARQTLEISKQEFIELIKSGFRLKFPWGLQIKGLHACYDDEEPLPQWMYKLAELRGIEWPKPDSGCEV